MHEAHFTEEIVDAILDELKKQPSKKFTRVKVSVGEMHHLEPESVKMHFELLTQGTNLQGVTLDLQETHVKVKCRECGHEGEVEDHHLLMCSKCESQDVAMMDGNRITIDEIEAE